ncbi:aldo/keto reductase, partial [Sulfurimonas sp.]|uniref:aldo/keto reductase n=1 Tax=Sulfurimonas sp. TaxID=2022749 RepID=UPI00261FB48F
MNGLNIPDSIKKKGLLYQRIYNGLIIRPYRKYISYKVIKSISWALGNGYRLIDTSAAYNNEKLIQEGIENSGVKRKELFIVTRVSNNEQWNGNIRKALQDSLRKLGLDYVDLYMFHWPVPNIFIQTWGKMEELYKEGLARSIGVANCHQHHLEALISTSSIIPAVNQFEIHPLMNQKELINFCRSKNINIMAYSPIGRLHEKIKNNQILNNLAEKHNKSVPQIVLRWHFQNGLVTVPRSLTPLNISANLNIFDFELSQDEIQRIDRINENLRLRFHPDQYN